MSEELKQVVELGGTLERATREMRELAKAFLSPVAAQAGEYVADKIRHARVENAARAFVRAREILAEAGVPLQYVELKVLLPIAEGASLEEEEGMTERWARLLASAASSSNVRPAFPRILAELTAAEALLLDHIADLPTGAYISREGGEPVRMAGLHGIEALGNALGWSDSDIRLSIDNLVRLRLATLSSPSLDDMNDKPMRVQGYQVPGLTDLGEAFVTACRGPRRQP